MVRKREKKCVLEFCESSGKINPNLRFFQFPSNEERFQKWCEVLQLPVDIQKNTFICEKHFTPNDFLTNKLSSSAIPSQKLNDNFEYDFEKENSMPVNKSGEKSYSYSLKENIGENSLANVNFYSKTPEKTKKKLVEKLRSPNLVESLQLISRKVKQRRLFNTCAEQCKCQYWKAKYISLLSAKNKLFLKTLVQKKRLKRSKECKKKLNINEAIDSVSDKNVSQNAKIFAKMILRSKNHKRVWPDDQRLLATSLLYKSPKAFQYLRNLGLNLPSKPTLVKHLPIKNIFPGLYEEQFTILEKRFKNAGDKSSNIAVLLFDEIHIRKDLTYDIKNDSIHGVADDGVIRKIELGSQICTFMLVGLVSEWSYVIGHIISSTSISAKELRCMVEKIIEKCKYIDLSIFAVVCDQGSNNRSLYKQLGVSEQTPFFCYKEQKIIAFFDFVHLIKTWRNILLALNIKTPDGVATWKIIVQLFEIDSGKTTRLCPKLKPEHINPNAFQKMRVKLATNIFSWSVSSAIRTINSTEGFKDCSDNALPTANLCEKLNNLFDIFNVKHIGSNSPYKQPINENSTFIFKYLHDLKEYFEKCKIESVNSNKTPSKRYGINIQNINAIFELIDMLKDIPNFKFLLTGKLQQDILEHLFSLIRCRGGYNKYPSAYEFTTHVKYLISSQIIKYEMVSKNSNCEVSEALLKKENCENNENESNCLSDNNIETAENLEEVETNLYSEEETLWSEIDDLENFFNIDVSSKNSCITELNALKYFAGYVAQKKCTKCVECKQIMVDENSAMEMLTDNLIKFKSYNLTALKCPTDLFFNVCVLQAKCFENFFKLNFHKRNLKKNLTQACIEVTRVQYPEWFLVDGQCYNHKIEVLDFFVLVLIRKHCKWISQTSKISHMAQDRLQILKRSASDVIDDTFNSKKRKL